MRWLNRMIAPATMNGSASMTWRKLRSSSEPSSQNAISSTTNGLLERFITSAVAAPARLEIASPARIRINNAGVAAGDREQHEHRGKGKDDRRDRQRIGSHVGEAERDHQHRAEGGRLRRAEQLGRGQRIAQQPLQRRAGQSQDRADRKGENLPRQADLPHDHLRHVAAAAEQGIDHGRPATAAPARSRARPAPAARRARQAPPSRRSAAAPRYQPSP